MFCLEFFARFYVKHGFTGYPHFFHTYPHTYPHKNHQNQQEIGKPSKPSKPNSGPTPFHHHFIIRMPVNASNKHH